MQVAPEIGRIRVGTAVFAGLVLGIATVVAIFSIVGTFPFRGPPSIASPQGLSAFDIYSQLQQFIDANARSAQQYSRYGVWFGGMGPMAKGQFGVADTLALAPSVASPTPSFT